MDPDIVFTKDDFKQEIVDACNNYERKSDITQLAMHGILSMFEYAIRHKIYTKQEILLVIQTLLEGERSSRKYMRQRFYERLYTVTTKHLSRQGKDTGINAMVDIISALHTRVNALEAQLLP